MKMVRLGQNEKQWRQPGKNRAQEVAIPCGAVCSTPREQLWENAGKWLLYAGAYSCNGVRVLVQAQILTKLSGTLCTENQNHHKNQ